LICEHLTCRRNNQLPSLFQKAFGGMAAWGQERGRRRKRTVAPTAPILVGADRQVHGPLPDGQVVDPSRLGTPVNIFTELTTMGAKAHGCLRDDGEATRFIRGGQLFVHDLEAIEIEQFRPESQLVLFAHERSSLKTRDA
jgi:hypothetical protein